MFQFRPFTEAEIAADPRLAMLVEDKRRLLECVERVSEMFDLFEACDFALTTLRTQESAERQREAAHYAAMQAENIRQGWKPATFREILGEPQYEPFNPKDNQQTQG